MDADLDAFFTHTKRETEQPLQIIDAVQVAVPSEPSGTVTSAKKPKREATPEEDERTLFLGNAPLSMARGTGLRRLRKLLEQFGSVESVRFRCIAFKGPGRRTPMMHKGEFAANRQTANAYAVYSTREDALKALALDGTELEGHVLRVDTASNPSKCDRKRSVYIGNLHFDANEDALRVHFEQVGKVRNVRIVRDKVTQIGKGFAYVEFDSEDSVPSALLLDGKPFQKRPLRIFKVLRKPVKLVQKSGLQPVSGAVRRLASKEKREGGGRPSAPYAGKGQGAKRDVQPARKDKVKKPKWPKDSEGKPIRPTASAKKPASKELAKKKAKKVPAKRRA